MIEAPPAIVQQDIDAAEVTRVYCSYYHSEDQRIWHTPERLRKLSQAAQQLGWVTVAALFDHVADRAEAETRALLGDIEGTPEYLAMANMTTAAHQHRNLIHRIRNHSSTGELPEEQRRRRGFIPPNLARCPGCSGLPYWKCPLCS